MWVKLVAYYRLGIANLARVGLYRLQLKSGWLRRITPIGEPISGPFWQVSDESGDIQANGDEKGKVSNNQAAPKTDIILFGWKRVSSDSPPDWQQSVLNGKTLSNNQKHWSLISDFDSGVGDIKGVWEFSRFSWALTFALNYLYHEDKAWLEKLNHWVTDWSSHNPVNQGANWKCAQEASLRVLHLASVNLLLKDKQGQPGLLQLIEQHLRRILPTMGYAIGQDNNHGTSEAAALYVGGSWLLQGGYQQSFAKKCMKTGSQMLANRADRLIMEDGTFSQYSVTYHRLMLDTYSFVELWRRFLKQPDFKEKTYDQLRKATTWLASVTDPLSGDTPNLGTNDGAQIMNFASTPYRDFRPSVELANQLFLNKTCFQTPECQQLLRLLQVKVSDAKSELMNRKCDQGGFGIIRSRSDWCLLRVPNYQFRPSQADNLHLDLWIAGQNVLRDGGSFSYNTDQKWLSYFAGCASHNCIEFDGREQMPKVSRFLFGAWPKFSQFDVCENQITAAYRDWQGVTHTRVVTLQKQALEVCDSFSGVRSSAILRWRLHPDLDWRLEGNSAIAANFRLQVTSDATLQRLTIAEGAESRYYGKKTPLAVLEAEVAADATIKTTLDWH